MALGLDVGRQKVAEKLLVLLTRGEGLLTRLYTMKKNCADDRQKPTCLTDKNFDPVIKMLLKKFPSCDMKSSSSQTAFLNQTKADIIRELNAYFFILVDLLDWREHCLELFTTVDALQLDLNIRTCFDITKAYLDLIVMYFSVIILISKVKDKKAILVLYNCAHDLQHGSSHQQYPKLAQTISDLDTPLKKMHEEFTSHTSALTQAIMSVFPNYQTRMQPAFQKLNAESYLSLTADPTKMTSPVYSQAVRTEFISLEQIEKWAFVSFTICHQQLQITELPTTQFWKMVLSNSYVITLFRDEVISPHEVLQNYFENVKHYGRRINEVKEAFQECCTSAPAFHKERRNFLRLTMHDMLMVFNDQPGLLGPKAVYLLTALSLARDEVLWLVKHVCNPLRKISQDKFNSADLVDSMLPELIFYMLELVQLAFRYEQVIQRYYVQFLGDYDAHELSRFIAQLPHCPDELATLVNGISDNIRALNLKVLEQGVAPDLEAVRLDWFRLQAHLSAKKGSLQAQHCQELVQHLNSVAFHTSLVDQVHETVKCASELSIFYSHLDCFADIFQKSLENTDQLRYSIALPQLCAHFIEATHELCPEEEGYVTKQATTYCLKMLEKMATEASKLLRSCCEEFTRLDEKLLPKRAVALLLADTGRTKAEKDRKNKARQEATLQQPGSESKRILREKKTPMDVLHNNLTSLLTALNHCYKIDIAGHSYFPREFFAHNLELWLNKAFVGMTMYNAQTCEIVKPTELLHSIRSILAFVRTLENHLSVGMSQLLLTSVLPHQTQLVNGLTGERTITANYTEWYCEQLRRKGMSQMVYSPARRAFVSLPSSSEQQLFVAEEYFDFTELLALVELIGPLGTHYIAEKLASTAGLHFLELKRVARDNQDTLHQLTRVVEKQGCVSRGLLGQLINTDQVCTRLIMAGVFLNFKKLLESALKDVLERRASFLQDSIRDFHSTLPHSQGSEVADQLASAAGFHCKIDPLVLLALRDAVRPEDREQCTLISVLLAAVLPQLTNNAVWKPQLDGFMNNVHCAGEAINQFLSCIYVLVCSKVDQESSPEQWFQQFLFISTAILHGHRDTAESKDSAPIDTQTVFLYNTLTECPFLTTEALESYLPYAMYRLSRQRLLKQN